MAWVIGSTGPIGMVVEQLRSAGPPARAAAGSPACSRATSDATWPGVRSVRMVSMAAMPMAPPRLRIRLNSPLASATSCGGQPSSARRVAGRRQNITARPRSTCGQNSASKSLVRVVKPLAIRPSAEQREAQGGQKPGIDAGLRPGRHRRGQQLRRARHHHDLADHQRRMPAHQAQEQRQQIDRTVKPEAQHES